jgi:hypothetical protein
MSDCGCVSIVECALVPHPALSQEREKRVQIDPTLPGEERVQIDPSPTGEGKVVQIDPSPTGRGEKWVQIDPLSHRESADDPLSLRERLG